MRALILALLASSASAAPLPRDRMPPPPPEPEPLTYGMTVLDHGNCGGWLLVIHEDWDWEETEEGELQLRQAVERIDGAFIDCVPPDTLRGWLRKSQGENP